MSQDLTKTISGPMSIAFGDSTPITVGPINEAFVKLTGETKKSGRDTTDGRRLSKQTGKELGFEISFDEVVPADMDSIEAKAGGKVVITLLGQASNNTLTIDDVEELLTDLRDNRTVITGFVTGDAESAWADLLAISTV